MMLWLKTDGSPRDRESSDNDENHDVGLHLACAAVMTVVASHGHRVDFLGSLCWHWRQADYFVPHQLVAFDTLTSFFEPQLFLSSWGNIMPALQVICLDESTHISLWHPGGLRESPFSSLLHPTVFLPHSVGGAQGPVAAYLLQGREHELSLE